jgi:rod shape determining protein RodA
MKRIKLLLLVCVFVLNVLSLLSLYSALHQAGEVREIGLLYKQMTWTAIGWIFFFIFYFINYRIYYDLSYPLYIISLVVLLAVSFFGKEVMGARRWISVFGMNFQPSEFAKVVIIFLLARSFCRIRETQRVFLKKVIVPFALVLINSFFIFLQPDLGTALIALFLFFIVGFSSRIRKIYFLFLLLVGVSFMPLGWNTLKDYQKKRLLVFLNPNVEPLGAGYTIIQSRIAIGSGKLAGKGFLSGTQNQFNFLPERHTDFIFTVVAEEWGFMCSLFLLVIYYLILRGILAIARESKDEFGFLLCIGIGGLYFLHIFVNIGMTMGILPVVGLPLLFLSYGGTHLLVSFILLGMVFNVAQATKQ